MSLKNYFRRARLELLLLPDGCRSRDPPSARVSSLLPSRWLVLSPAILRQYIHFLMQVNVVGHQIG
jgi:hypothetical protein